MSDGAGGAGPDSPIERYLDELTRLLAPGHPRELRYLLEETEAHLHDATAAAMSGGLSASEAEQSAVRRLGPPETLARAELNRQRPAMRVVAIGAAVSAVVLASIGSIAVGISGAIAAIIRAAGGDAAVAAPTRSALSAADCARWLSHDPAASTCRAAATADWAAETIYYRLALGVIGAVALGTLALLRRRTGGQRLHQLPRMMFDTIGASAFAVAGAWTLALGLDALVVSAGHGWGQWLSAVPVCIAGAAVFARRALEDVRVQMGATLSSPA